MLITGRESHYWENEVESVEEFRKLHPDATIESIDDKEVLAFCEGCGIPRFAGDDEDLLPDDGWGTTLDDCDLCPKCGEGMERTDA